MSSLGLPGFLPSTVRGLIYHLVFREHTGRVWKRTSIIVLSLCFSFPPINIFVSPIISTHTTQNRKRTNIWHQRLNHARWQKEVAALEQQEKEHHHVEMLPEKQKMQPAVWALLAGPAPLNFVVLATRCKSLPANAIMQA